MIALGDMIFKGGYNDFYMQYLNNGDCSAAIGVREVDDPSKYGIVVQEPDTNYVKRVEEKPEHPPSNLAIAGVYFISDSPLLFRILETMIDNDIRTRGEYQLTDALQKMIHAGGKIKTFTVSSWYDCGHFESLLETNRVLLEEKSDADKASVLLNSVIIPPVAIGENVSIKSSVIGPHTSIASDSQIESSIISDSIIGSRTRISKVNLQASIIGDDASVNGKHNSLNIGDSSSIEF